MTGTEDVGARAPDQLPGGPMREPAIYRLTIDADQGRILKLEKIDSNGMQHELSNQEQAMLARSDPGPTLKTMIEQSFEAGLNCLLDAADEQDDAQEPREVVELRRTLLQSLISQTKASALLHDKALGAAIVRTAFQEACRSAE